MIKIGLTGGIGAGKTTVSKVFEEMGYPVYIADREASRLMVENPEIRKDLISLLGKEVYQEDGLINRKWLANIIFNDKQVLEQVNAIVHPRVREDFNSWADRQTVELVVFESALLFESKQEKNFDFVVCIYADLSIRIERVMKRDNITEQQVIERINNQMDNKKKCELSDFVIDTGKQADLHKQVKDILNIIRKK